MPFNYILVSLERPPHRWSTLVLNRTVTKISASIQLPYSVCSRCVLVYPSSATSSVPLYCCFLTAPSGLGTRGATRGIEVKGEGHRRVIWSSLPSIHRWSHTCQVMK